ncbi:MAG: type II toxin-antitoxin system VapC family toxin [Rhodoferax sp.]|nr:type II toxin-antitoxin system VapC family toxin [Rhodoferax sp.]
MTVATSPATLDEAIVDSSALMCILLGEPAAPLFIDALQKTRRLYISAATRAEVWLAAFNAKGSAGAQQVEALLAALQVETVDFTQDALPYFMAGAERHHHKVDAKARLNLGDLFSYALATETALPLFFQGTDFANTALANAMLLLGYGVSDKGVPQPLAQ